MNKVQIEITIAATSMERAKAALQYVTDRLGQANSPMEMNFKGAGMNSKWASSHEVRTIDDKTGDEYEETFTDWRRRS